MRSKKAQNDDSKLEEKKLSELMLIREGVSESRCGISNN
jgi:hypothetical protein